MGISLDELSADDYLVWSEKYKTIIQEAPQPLYPLTGDLIEVSLKSPENRVTPLPASENFNYSTYQIDRCLLVTVPSTKFRESMVQHWEAERAAASRNTWVGRTASVIGGVAAVAAYIYAQPIIAAIAATVAVASLVFSTFKSTTKNHASSQKAGWEMSPIGAIAEERKKAYKNGFTYVYDHRLKMMENSNQGVLLPFEVEFLFERHFDKFCDELLFRFCPTEDQRKIWLETFRQYNPVSKKVLEYVYGSIPEIYKMVSYDYENLAVFLNDLQQKFKDSAIDQTSKAKRIKQDINARRRMALLPFELNRDHLIEVAKKERDEKLAQLPAGTPAAEKQKIDIECELAVSKAQTFYHAATLLPNLYYDEQIENTEQRLEQILNIIRANEASAVAPHFDYARVLLNSARQVKEKHYTYSQSKFTPTDVLNFPTLSAPAPVKIDFVELASQQQKPPGIAESDYADYLKFLQWEAVKEEIAPPTEVIPSTNSNPPVGVVSSDENTPPAEPVLPINPTPPVDVGFSAGFSQTIQIPLSTEPAPLTNTIPATLSNPPMEEVPLVQPTSEVASSAKEVSPPEMPLPQSDSLTTEKPQEFAGEV